MGTRYRQRCSWGGDRRTGSIHHAWNGDGLVVIGLRDYALYEKQLGEPLVGIAGRRCLAELRDFISVRMPLVCKIRTSGLTAELLSAGCCAERDPQDKSD